VKTIGVLRPASGPRIVISGAAAGTGAAIAQAFLCVDANLCIREVDPVAIGRANADKLRLHSWPH
jgi:NAD(P)-dependent dehydrogenase (short-subunit alcohol dehydrogenase family)